jgi:large subunit ribosomal protein L13
MLQQKSYQAKQSGPHLYETKGPNAPKWYIVDAKDQVVGRLATVLARVLTGKHKPTYTTHADTGDFVVVLNADKVVFTRNKWSDKLYRDHTGYVGGLKTKTAKELLKRNPTEILRLAVYGMTNKSSMARLRMKKLKLYTSAEHPHAAQNPQPLPMGVTRHTALTKKPKRLK